MLTLIEEVVDVQQQWLHIAQKHPSIVATGEIKKFLKMIAKQCNEKDGQIEKLGDFGTDTKRKENGKHNIVVVHVMSSGGNLYIFLDTSIWCDTILRNSEDYIVAYKN